MAFTEHCWAGSGNSPPSPEALLVGGGSRWPVDRTKEKRKAAEDREDYSWQREQQHNGLELSEWAEAGQEVERQWGARSWESLGIPRG